MTHADSTRTLAGHTNADTAEGSDALAALLPRQRADFVELFRAMGGLPVTVRLLDPESMHFFHEVGLDYVSCSPFRVPVARLEAGRAAVTADGSDSR